MGAGSVGKKDGEVVTVNNVKEVGKEDERSVRVGGRGKRNYVEKGDPDVVL